MKFIIAFLLPVVSFAQSTTTTLLQEVPASLPEIPFADMDLMAKIIAGVVALNLALSGIGKALDSLGISKGILGKISALLSSIVDWLGANRKH